MAPQKGRNANQKGAPTLRALRRLDIPKRQEVLHPSVQGGIQKRGGADLRLVRREVHQGEVGRQGKRKEGIQAPLLQQGVLLQLLETMRWIPIAVALGIVAFFFGLGIACFIEFVF